MEVDATTKVNPQGVGGCAALTFVGPDLVRTPLAGDDGMNSNLDACSPRGTDAQQQTTRLGRPRRLRVPQPGAPPLTAAPNPPSGLLTSRQTGLICTSHWDGSPISRPPPESPANSSNSRRPVTAVHHQ